MDTIGTADPVIVTVTLTREIEPQFLFDTFIAACEGGVNYWADVTRYHWQNSDGTDDVYGFSAVLVDQDTGEKHGIGWNAIVGGIRLILSCAVGSSEHWEALSQAIADGDDGAADADLADAIVQAGVFGRLIYG